MKFDLSDRKMTGLRLFLVWLVWLICVSTMAGFLAGPGTRALAFLAWFAASMAVLLFLAWLILLPRENFRLLLAAFRWPGYRWLLGALLIGALLQLGTVGIPGLYQALAGDFSMEKRAVEMANHRLMDPSWALIYYGLMAPNVLMVPFMVPITQELFFRGLLLSYLCARMRAGPALWLSALLFTLPHIAPFDKQMLEYSTGIFISGMLLGYLYLKTANLWAPIIVQFGANITNAAVGHLIWVADSGSAAAGFVVSSLIGLNALNYALIALTVSGMLYLGLRGWNRRLNPLQLAAAGPKTAPRTDPRQDNEALAQIPADRGLVEALYAGGRISKEARHYALALLYPRHEWGLWTARLLLALGTALLLAGVIYFFAFNWAKIPPAAKLAGLEAALIGCLVMACRAALKNLQGQLWLLAASVLTGVFLAVFGQIYQTGADAWQLFALWVLLVLGWAGIAAFAAHWLLWLLLANIALWLWWDQAALPGEDMAFMILLWLTLLNGAALALREYFAVARGRAWLAARWTRLLLTITVLLCMLISALIWIFDGENASLSMKLSGATGVLGHLALYYLYRHLLADLWSLTATVLSACIMLDCVVIKTLIIDPGRFISHAILLHQDSLLLLAGLLTIGLFTAATLYLKRAARHMATEHA